MIQKVAKCKNIELLCDSEKEVYYFEVTRNKARYYSPEYSAEWKAWSELITGITWKKVKESKKKVAKDNPTEEG